MWNNVNMVKFKQILIPISLVFLIFMVALSVLEIELRYGFVLEIESSGNTTKLPESVWWTSKFE